MRKIDTIGLKLCEEQAKLFEKSVSLANCSSPQFIKRFVHSSIVKDFDNLSIINVPFNEEDVIEVLNYEYGPTTSNNKYGENTMYWIGYIYRYWCYIYELDNLNVYKMVKPDELKSLFYPYHTLDIEIAIERIMEVKQIKDKMTLSYQVELYRQIIKNRKKTIKLFNDSKY